MKSGDPSGGGRRGHVDCYDFVASAPETAPDRAILAVWISVNKWISPGAQKNFVRFGDATVSMGRFTPSRQLMRSQEYVAAANLPQPAESRAATRLCIISRTPLVSGVFISGLTASVGAREALEIVVDRRRGDAPPDPIPIERRQRDHVDRALERQGFAFVRTGTPDGTNGATEETYERKLERILWLKHARIIRLGRLLILSTLLNAILLPFFVVPAVKALTQARSAASAPAAVAPVDKAGERAPRSLP